MSGALVKWRGGELVKAPSPIDENRRALNEALALLKPAPPARTQAAGEIVDLPRLCGVHEGRAYAARYVRGSDGRFHHAQTIKVTEALFLGQYADSAQKAVVPGEDITDETCPWCGASGFGSIHCGTCGHEVCYGRTAGRFFRCRLSCGGKGNMTTDNRAHVGVAPHETRGGGYRV